MQRRRLLSLARGLAPTLVLPAIAGCAAVEQQLSKPSGAKVLGAGTAPTSVEGRFRLQDVEGRTVTEADYAGRPWLIYFGYTNCPEICWLELTTMAAVKDEVATTTPDLALIFVTVDPGRDTPGRLADFAAFFHPELKALRAEEPALSRSARSFKVYYRLDDQMNTRRYKVDHSTFMYLFDRQGRFVRAFPYNTDPQRIEDEVVRI